MPLSVRNGLAQSTEHMLGGKPKSLTGGVGSKYLLCLKILK